jgi:hypothetical protein
VVASNFDRNKLSTARLNAKGGVVPGLATKVTTLESRVRTMLGDLGASSKTALSTMQVGWSSAPPTAPDVMSPY